MMLLEVAVKLVLQAPTQPEWKNVLIKTPTASSNVSVDAVCKHLDRTEQTADVIGVGHCEKLFEVFMRVEEIGVAGVLRGYFLIKTVLGIISSGKYIHGEAIDNDRFGGVGGHSPHTTLRFDVDGRGALIQKAESLREEV